MWVSPLSWEDPLEEGMTIHSSILSWSITWTEEPDGLKIYINYIYNKTNKINIKKPY